MRDSSDARFSSAFLRWSMLIVVAASVMFIADYSHLSASPTVAEVLAQYGPAFVPAGFATAIGAAILTALLGFFYAALRPRRRRIRIYDRLVIPVALASVLAACWIVAFRHREIGLSVALLAASVVVGSVLFLRVAAVSPGKHSRWLLVPFSLYLGAMTVALLVVAPLWLNAEGVLGGALAGRDDLATASFVVAAAAGGFFALRYRDFVYPAVIASALGSAFLAHPGEPLGQTALVVGVGMLVVAALAAVALARQPRRDLADSVSRRRADTVRKAKAEGWYLTDASTSIMRV
jgi:hypothetical protein